jgi:hypothetical protein
LPPPLNIDVTDRDFIAEDSTVNGVGEGRVLFGIKLRGLK